MNSISKNINGTNIEISRDKITMGQGEYVVFHNFPDGEKKGLSKETFDKVYQVLLKYYPAAIINSGVEKTAELCANRFVLINKEIKEIDPSLEAQFIPKTLYELAFIRKCIKEDIKQKKKCPFLSVTLQQYLDKEQVDIIFSRKSKEEREAIYKDNQDIKTKRKCWHVFYFNNPGDNEHEGVKEIAHRMNNVLIKNCELKKGTYEEFSALTEKQIDFLKDKGCYQYGTERPMSIPNETTEQFIKNALALDCSRIAEQSTFLYRGSDFQKDAPFKNHSSSDMRPFSLSYGSSVFAGCLYDAGATAFTYLRKETNAHAIFVPFDQLNDSPFYIPTTNTVAQLFGKGETFHGRTKTWKDFDVEKMEGMYELSSEETLDHLKSNLSKEEFLKQFQEYKSKAIQLKIVDL